MPVGIVTYLQPPIAIPRAANSQTGETDKAENPKGLDKGGKKDCQLVRADVRDVETRGRGGRSTGGALGK